MTAIDPAMAASVLRDEMGRRRIIPFAELVYPSFETPPHVRYISERLEALERGDKRKVAISVPVRHGKSVLCSQVLPAFALGKDPTRNIAIASHGESLAVMHARVAKQIITDERYPFTDVAISADSSSNQRFNVTSSTRQAGGGCYAIGVDGTVTGRGFDFFIIDDALHDGLSQSERDAAWAWYTEVATPRLEPGGRVIVVGARFAEDDLIGRIQDSEDAAGWEFIRLPALSEGEDVDPLRRPRDAPLWPARMGREEIEQRRVTMGSRAFSAQFQQTPVPVGGAMIEAAWLEHRYDVLPNLRIDGQPHAFASLTRDPLQSLINRELHRPEMRVAISIQAIDTASAVNAKADQTAIATIRTNGRDYYIEDLAYGRYGYTDLKKFIATEYLRHRDRVRRIYIERDRTGMALCDELQAILAREPHRPQIVGVDVASGKHPRIEWCLPLWESGKILLPRNAPWLESFLNEALRYPFGKHDDLLDAVSLGVLKLNELLSIESQRLRFDRQVANIGNWFERS